MALNCTHNIKVEESISPQFFTGFVQKDGCFHVNIQKDNTAKHKIRLKPYFYVTQLNTFNKQISPILRYGRDLLQTGHYVADKRLNCSSLRVNTLKGLMNNVLPHFEKYPLLSRKKEDYLVFREIVEKMKRKLHLDEKVFLELVEKAVLMNNKGRYRKKYKTEKHENTIQTTTINSIPLDSQFVSGLFQGDGSFGFTFRITKTKKNKRVPKVSPFFTLGQEKDSKDLLEKVKVFFKSGNLYSVSLNYSRWMVTDSFSLKENVLPHFKSNPLYGLKNQDFDIFKECLDILTKDEECKTRDTKRVERVIELCYDLNMGGKRRRLSKEEYLRAIAS